MNKKLCLGRLSRAQQLGIWLVATAFWMHAMPATAHQQADPVIVDTDMALDDARALALLLTAPELDVKAIVTSDGSAPPKPGATNVLRILHFLGRDDIPVGAGHTLNKPAPLWTERSVTLGWSDLPVPQNPTIGEAVSVLCQVFDNSTNRFVWFCLGPMSNLAELLRRRPDLKERISRVFFYGGHPDAPDPGWNTKRDPDSARAVFNSGLSIVAVQLPNKQALSFDASLLEQIQKLDAPAAKLITRLHAHTNVQRLVEARHFRAWDESVVLLFHEPRLGQVRPWAPGSPVSVLESFDVDAARAAYVEELRLGGTAAAHRSLVTLREFPVAPELFQPDLQPLVSEIVDRHGAEEWKLVVLTSELHRHLGLYSILGAKMGLRARELLGAGLDELRVESFAGLKPPVSCLNDGLQVATGASLGRGTIRVIETTNAEPAAVFIYGTRKLHMRIRPEILERVRGTLSALAAEHGESTPANFAALRRFSIEAWRDLDRTKIFEEKFEAGANPAGN